MKFNPEALDIRTLLKSFQRFEIPTFQRDYSWDKNYYQTFLDDIIDNISCQNGKLEINDYFIGTMVFAGKKSDDYVEVVDGQQRLTVITILFSVIAEKFKKINNLILSDSTFEFVKSKDDYGQAVSKLNSSSSFPYFTSYIQSLDKSEIPKTNTDEEEYLKETYNFFDGYLNLSTLYEKKNDFKNLDVSDENERYIEILIKIRDQILRSTLIAITTEDKESAYKIFEILNAKGKSLASIDLVKNIIFESFHSNTDRRDSADKYWADMKSQLRGRGNDTGLATFYRHFWISKYNKVKNTQLYDSFKKGVKKEDYFKFLKELKEESKRYIQIIYPELKDYNNRQEYKWLVQSFREISQTFGVVQSRIVFLALLDLKETNRISHKQLKKSITFIENFIFTHSTVLKKPANIYEVRFSKLAIELRKVTSQSETNDILKNFLYDVFEAKFPVFDEFEKAFMELNYSANSKMLSNPVTRYIIRKINQHKSGREIFADDITIEHILCEDENNADTLNIGNLIGLERKINEQADSRDYPEKINFYKESSFLDVKEFIEKYQDREFTRDIVEERAKEMARYYYDNIPAL